MIEKNGKRWVVAKKHDGSCRLRRLEHDSSSCSSILSRALPHTRHCAKHFRVSQTNSMIGNIISYILQISKMKFSWLCVLSKVTQLGNSRVDI